MLEAASLLQMEARDVRKLGSGGGRSPRVPARARARTGWQKGAYGIGVAWGTGVQPSATNEIMLCTPHRLASALELVLKPPR